MKIVLLRVGIDSGCGGCQSPLFKEGSFEFVPIPTDEPGETRTYANTKCLGVGRTDKCLLDFLPEHARRHLQSAAMHVDPEFETFTYGDPTTPKARLRELEAGDLLVFYAGLQGWDCGTPPGLYIVGYFEIEKVVRATGCSRDELASEFGKNFHVGLEKVFNFDTTGKRDLILIKGSRQSRLLKKARLISELGADKSGKPLKVLSAEMRQVFGDFGGKVSIQRSPPRWVAPQFVEKAKAFVMGLE